MKIKRITNISQAILSIGLLTLGFEKAAAQIDPVLLHTSNNTNETHATVPGISCSDGSGEAF